MFGVFPSSLFFFFFKAIEVILYYNFLFLFLPHNLSPWHLSTSSETLVNHTVEWLPGPSAWISYAFKTWASPSSLAFHDHSNNLNLRVHLGVQRCLRALPELTMLLSWGFCPSALSFVTCSLCPSDLIPLPHVASIISVFLGTCRQHTTKPGLLLLSSGLAAHWTLPQSQ